MRCHLAEGEEEHGKKQEGLKDGDDGESLLVGAVKRGYRGVNEVSQSARQHGYEECPVFKECDDVLYHVTKDVNVYYNIGTKLRNY